MATVGFVIAEVAATVYLLLAVQAFRVPRTDWSRWYGATLMCIGAYEAFDGFSVAFNNRTMFELMAKGTWFLAPLSLIFWWMTTGKLVRANPSSLHGYLRSTATVSAMMLAAALAAFGFTDRGLFAQQTTLVESPWTTYHISPSPLYLLMILLTFAVTLVSVINIVLAKRWRPAAVSTGLLVSAVGFAVLGPFASINFYFAIGVPEPALFSVMALTAYAGVRSLSISPSSSGAQVIDERHAGKCLGIHLYPNAREVTADSRSVELSSGEYALLEFLVIRCDRLVRYEEIYAGGLTASIDTVQTEVSTIRRKLGLGKSVIKNKTSAGYIIASRSLCPFMERRDS